jgi:hypothetical protein
MACRSASLSRPQRRPKHLSPLDVVQLMVGRLSPFVAATAAGLPARFLRCS